MLEIGRSAGELCKSCQHFHGSVPLGAELYTREMCAKSPPLGTPEEWPTTNCVDREERETIKMIMEGNKMSDELNTIENPDKTVFSRFIALVVGYGLAAMVSTNVSMTLSATVWTSAWTYVWWAVGYMLAYLTIAAGIFALIGIVFAAIFSGEFIFSWVSETLRKLLKKKKNLSTKK